MTTEIIPIGYFEAAGEVSAQATLAQARPGALPPLIDQLGVRMELIEDCMSFMDEYDDVFRSLAQ